MEPELSLDIAPYRPGSRVRSRPYRARTDGQSGYDPRQAIPFWERNERERRGLVHGVPLPLTLPLIRIENLKNYLS